MSKTKRTRRVRPDGAAFGGTKCGHCGSARVCVQLGELVVFVRNNPISGLQEAVRVLLSNSGGNMPVYLCPGCFCVTTDRGAHAF